MKEFLYVVKRLFKMALPYIIILLIFVSITYFGGRGILPPIVNSILKVIGSIFLISLGIGMIVFVIVEFYKLIKSIREDYRRMVMRNERI